MNTQDKGRYLLLLPGQTTPQPFNIGAGWTVWGFKGQIVDKLFKGTDTCRIRLSIKGTEIPDGAMISDVTDDGQVIKVEVNEAEGAASSQASGSQNSAGETKKKGLLARMFHTK